MNKYQFIKEKLTNNFPQSIIDIQDVSYLHANHQEVLNSKLPSKETHFNLKIVSDNFKNLSLINRHRLIYNILDFDTNDNIHALSIKAYTNEEYSKI